MQAEFHLSDVNFQLPRAIEHALGSTTDITSRRYFYNTALPVN